MKQGQIRHLVDITFSQENNILYVAKYDHQLLIYCNVVEWIRLLFQNGLEANIKLLLSGEVHIRKGSYFVGLFEEGSGKSQGLPYLGIRKIH